MKLQILFTDYQQLTNRIIQKNTTWVISAENMF